MVFPLGDSEKTRIVPVITYALIALNVGIYLYQQSQPESFTIAYAATPFEITHNVDLGGEDLMEVQADEDPQVLRARAELAQADIAQAPIRWPVWLTLLTSMFLHASPLHLAGNMLYLWIFGDNVEEVLGAVRYLIAYLACGLAGTLAQVAAVPSSVVPILGASGAIAGVMGAYVVWFPRNRVRVLVFPYLVLLPARWVVGFWIVLQVWLVSRGSTAQAGDRGGVGYLAHVVGALTGIGVALLFRERARAVTQRNSREGWFASEHAPGEGE
jgi:membrane associated rhomboid family serine protease